MVEILRAATKRPGIILYAAFLSSFFVNCNQPEPQGPYSTPIIYYDTTIIWSADSDTIKLARSIVIDSSSTLIIEPGVTIYLVENSMLHIGDMGMEYTSPPDIRIEGGFVCLGTDQEPISFSSYEDYHKGLYIPHDTTYQMPIKISWLLGIDNIRIIGAKPSISHSEVGGISLSDCDSFSISNSTLDGISIYNSTGQVSHNSMNNIYTQASRVQVDSNQIGSESEQGYYGIHSSHDDASIFTSNDIVNFRRAVYILSGSPTLNYNNIIECPFPIEVVSFVGMPDSDTLDFEMNWWETRYSRDLLNAILYESNGGTVSEKVIDVLPIATTPFNHDY